MGRGRTFFAPRVKAKSCFPGRRESAAVEFQGPEEVEAPQSEGAGPAHSAQGEFFMAVSGKLFAQRTRRGRRDCMPRCTRTGRSSRRPRAAAGTTGVPCAISVLDVCQPIRAKHRSRLRPSRYRETGSCQTRLLICTRRRAMIARRQPGQADFQAHSPPSEIGWKRSRVSAKGTAR